MSDAKRIVEDETHPGSGEHRGPNKGFVDGMREEGWELIETGGGATAFSRTFDGTEFLITDDAQAPNFYTSPCSLGMNDHNGGYIGSFTDLTVNSAVKLVKSFK